MHNLVQLLAADPAAVVLGGESPNISLSYRV